LVLERKVELFIKVLHLLPSPGGRGQGEGTKKAA
jgi:hypothetical protein